ncbi:MAG TPA: hypothetical protein VLC74_09895 [Rhizomicrobium sp.]|nr:hypothetical protein [Rhizomicrobium sp.]
MNIGQTVLFSSAALCSLGVTDALAADPPLFAAFKQFCADTQAKPDAVKAAALAVSSKTVASAATNKKAQASASGNSWSLVFQGHHLTVTSGTLHTPAAANMPPTDAITCAITDSDGDNAGASSIGAWAGVPASAQVKGIFGTYVYQQKNGTRVAVKAPETAVKDPEGVWNLTLTQVGQVTAVNLAHATAARH